MASMKKGKKISHKGQRAQYAASSRWLTNRKLKLQRHVKKFPEDTQAVKALKNLNSKFKQRNGGGSPTCDPKPKQVFQIKARTRLKDFYKLEARAAV